MPKAKQISKTDRLFYRLERERIWEQQNRRCKYCCEKITRDEATMDHVVPISKVGYHSFNNCVVACWDCNQDKANDPDWTYTEPERTEMGQMVHDMIEEWSQGVDERLRKFEYSLAIDTKGSYNKWLKYWQKRGKWD